MKNTRTLISSSIVSIIIIVLGLFMLCMSRAPKINVDEPLVEGGGVEFDSAGVDDQNFLTLLNETNDETEVTGETTSTSSDDSNILDGLNDEDQNFATDTQSSGSGDEGMEEILRLLETEEGSNSGEPTLTDETSLEQDLNTVGLSENSGQQQETGAPAKDAINNLNNEVKQLEGVLADKTTQVENLRAEVNTYDQKISSYKNQSATSQGKTAPVRNVSYQETTPIETSNYSADSYTSSAAVSGDYETNYNAAIEMFQNHQHQQAIDIFYKLLEQNSKHPLADNCQYWIGESRFAQGKFYQALVEFNKVFAYDAPDKQDDAQLMLGLTYMKLGEVNRAQSEFDWLVTCYGSSEYVQTAHRYLGNF